MNVIDVEKSKVHSDQTVKLRDGKILSMGRSRAADAQDEGWTVVDAEGLYMCPGLIDCKKRSFMSMLAR